MIDLTESSGVPIIINSDFSLSYNKKEVMIEEIRSRKLKEMAHLFKDASGYDLETDLYYMYNGVFNEKDRTKFKEHKARYEYTVLKSMRINEETIKSFGHIHNVNQKNQRRYEEAYEILYGQGSFLLFKIVDKEIEVSILDTKVGDIFFIPSCYYHLSINTGKDPFIFGDLILESLSSDYSFLDKMNGAPLFYHYDQTFNNFNFEFNPAYQSYKISVRHITFEDINAEHKLPQTSLYSTFLEKPEIYDFVLK